MKSVPFHTDMASLAAREHDGHIPLSWTLPTMPSEFYAKAAVIAAVAWEVVRNTDPPFPACTISHRERLIAEVEALLKCGAPSDQSVLTPFLEAALAVIESINKSEQLRLDGETELNQEN